MDTFWGVVLGGLIAVSSNYVLHRTQLGREREARREQRRDAAHDRKRQALFELQETLETLQTLVLEQVLRALEGTQDVESPFDVLKLRTRIEMLIARVIDDETGKKARRAANVAYNVLGLSNRDALAEQSDRLAEAMRDFHERSGEMLRELD